MCRLSKNPIFAIGKSLPNPSKQTSVKRLVSFLMLVTVLITVGCSSADEMPQIKEESQEVIAPGHVSRDVSCRILNKVLAQANFKTSDGICDITRMANENDCRAYNAAGEELTRADEEDARFYVFNIGTEGDYAIMGAHTTVPPMLVLATGTSQPDSNDSVGFKNAITNLPHNLPVIDSIGVDKTEFVKCYDYSNAEYSLVNGVEPLTYKWGPHAPWNTENAYLKPNPDNVANYANNCSCIAMAMILTNEHYRPKSFNGENFPDWDLVSAYKYEGIILDSFSTNNGLSAVVHLIHFLSQEKLMNVCDWGKWTSYNSTGSIKPAFANLGYQVQEMPFNGKEISSSIEAGYPVFVLGQKLDGEDAGPCHSWVVSAILKAKVPYYYVAVNDFTAPEPDVPITYFYETQTLVHHNWGWAGQGDGFYFDAIEIQSGQDVILDDSFNIIKAIDRHHGWGLYGNLSFFKDKRVND